MVNAAQQAADRAEREHIRNRWLLSAPALLIILVAAIGPLAIVVLYSFMVKGDYGDVKYWQFSGDAWFNVLFERDMFDDTPGVAWGNIAIF
mgnify:FL=1